MDSWFTVDQIDSDTYIISEYRHWEETHCYLLCGEERSLLIDTGLGIGNIQAQVARLTDKPITAVATHVHWDHIGGHGHYPEFYVHEDELDWISGGFPIPLAQVKKSVADRCMLPEGFVLDDYAVFQGKPTGVLKDGDSIALGGRRIEVLHTPGHSPGHMCFYERDRGYLFSGDLVYAGTLYAFYPSTDPVAYLHSARRVAMLPDPRVFPGHHALDVPGSILRDVRDAFAGLAADGKLHHGSGTHAYGYFSISL